MGQESRSASVIYPLKKSKWDKGHYELLLFTPWQSQTSSEQQGQDGFVLFSPWQSQTNSEQQERNKQQGQNWPRVKTGFCSLPPDRVKLAVNSKKETNSRVKMGKGQDGLLLFTPWKSQNGAAAVYPLTDSS